MNATELKRLLDAKFSGTITPQETESLEAELRLRRKTYIEWVNNNIDRD